MTSSLSFYKMTGSGNDFVFLDGRLTAVDEWTPDRIARLCNRRTGVGSDGMVLLEERDSDRVRFHYFNADGSRGEMCGNAALCATNLAPMLGLVEPGNVLLETDSGDFVGMPGPGPARASVLLDGAAKLRDRSDLITGSGERRIWAATVGVPHLVLVVDDCQAPAADPLTRGRSLRHHPAFSPAGTNVNFVAKLEDGTWWMRTFERGVEAETLACGTGAVAAASVLARLGLGQSPITLRTGSGKELVIALDPDNGKASLQGEGRLVYRGILEADVSE